MADKFMQTTEWAHMPQGVTRENFLESMRRENAKVVLSKPQRNDLRIL